MAMSYSITTITTSGDILEPAQAHGQSICIYQKYN